MTFCWACLIDVLSQALDPMEREVVLGDLAELDLHGAEAASHVAGLVLRREVQPLTRWQPWLMLMGVIVPAAVLLSAFTTGIADADSVPLWMYTSNWTPCYLQPGWLLSELIPGFAAMAFSWLVLASWSWTSGLLVASFRTFRLPLIATIVALVIAATARSQTRTDGAIPGIFYKMVFPLTLQLVLVFFPILLGMRHRLKLDSMAGPPRRMVEAAQFVTLAAFLVENRSGWHSGGQPGWILLPHLGRCAPLALAGPLAFALASLAGAARARAATSAS